MFLDLTAADPASTPQLGWADRSSRSAPPIQVGALRLAEVPQLAQALATVRDAAAVVGQGPVSTDDVASTRYATSLRLAGLLALRELHAGLRGLRFSLRERAGSVPEVDDAVRLALRSRLSAYADDVAGHERAFDEVAAGLCRLAPQDAELAAPLAAEVGALFTTGREPDENGLLELSRSLKPLAVRLAQIWSGLSLLDARANGRGVPVQLATVNRTALEVISAALHEELRDAEGPGAESDLATLLSVLASVQKLRDAVDAIAAWCDASETSAEQGIAA